MIDHGKKNLLGVRIDAVDYEGALARIMKATEAGQRCTCAALAVHGVMTGVLDPEQRYRLNHLDLVVPDGQPVRWGLNLLYGLGLPDRVYGPSLTLKVCEIASRRGLPIFLYGSQPEVVGRMARNLQERFPGLDIAGAEPSKFRRLSPEEKTQIVQRIRSSGAAITLVGLGCPRQEVWVFEFGDDLQMPSLAVGAAFDFHAGSIPQAPARLQRLGLEWFYRLAQEPGRLWKRYLLLNPLFVTLLSLQLFRLKRFDPERLVVAPKEDLLYG